MMHHLHEDHCNHDHSAEMLNEMTYQDLLKAVNPNDLPHRNYSSLIRYVKLVGIKDNIAKFFVPNSLNGWNCFFQFVEWDDVVADRSLKPQEAARLLLWSGNIRFHCNCPSYLFWGYQYIMTQLDAAMVPEERFPKIKNPQLKGIMCKHGRRSVLKLGFYLGDIAQAIKIQRGNS